MKREDYHSGHEELSPPGDGDARRFDARRAPAGGGTACQSAISQPKQSLDEVGAEIRGTKFEVWSDGNKVQVTPRKSILPATEKEITSEAPKRGNITICTWRSMARLKDFLSEVRTDAHAYTLCLTYPHKFPKANIAKKHFARLKNCINKKYPQYGMVWKREPQKRLATHFHILAFLEQDFYISKEVGDYILMKWCEIVSGEGSAYSEADHAKQVAVHSYFDPKELEEGFQGKRKNSFQRMFGKSFFEYLGKYISKDSGDIPAGYCNEGGGAWWNKINKKSIPLSEKKEKVIELSKEQEKRVMRPLYKLRDIRKQKRLDSLSFTENPRLAAERLERVFNQKSPGQRPEVVRKAARKFFFKMDGSRSALLAPIKAKKSYWYGAVKFHGDPQEITDLIRRLLMPPAIDKEARARIFSDSYTPSL